MQPLYFVVEMNYSTHELYATRTHRIMALTQDENAAHTFVQNEETKRKQITESINKLQGGQVQIIHPKRPTDKPMMFHVVVTGDEIGIAPEDQQIVIDHIGNTLNVVGLGMFDTVEELVDAIKINERYTRRAEIK
ncbi:MAG: hypothetical protein I4N51_07225 [Acinetobacter sp.]|nr:hypothetical protein [Acinetobacter sp.]